MSSTETTSEPYITLSPHPRVSRRVDVEYVGATVPYNVSWGDGDFSSARWHRYARPGAYQVQLRHADTNAFLAQKLAVVRGGISPVGYEITRHPENTAEVRVQFTDTGDDTGVLPHFAVEWPKTKDRVSAWGVPGQHVARLLPYGEHIVEVTDLTSGRVAREQVTVSPPEYEPDYVIRRKTGGDNLTAEVEITKTSGKDIVISWHEEGSAPEVYPTPQVGDTFTHTYRDPGEGNSTRHLVQVAYDDGTGESKTTGITVPLA